MDSNMKTWFDYYRNDIRLHDSNQAGEIARRYGIEPSFTQSHIPESDQKGKLVTSESRFLIKRSNNALRLGEGSDQHGDKLYMQELQLNLAKQQIHSQPMYTYQSPATPEVVEQQLTGIVPNSTVLQRINEIEYQSIQKVMKADFEGERSLKSQSHREMPELDPEQVATKVYRLMCQDMIIERERGAV